jgi:SAM-dependent methyltransferase
MTNTVSRFDVDALRAIRRNVDAFMRKVGGEFGSTARDGAVLLDVAPQEHSGARPFFPETVCVETLDLNPDSGATYIADLCDCASTIGVNRFDFIVCTEVLEHTLHPFDAVASIYSMLKPGGLAFISTPFNFRIHGPLPDCWRFTEHGLRELFRDFHIMELSALETPDRFLMPLQYTLIARKGARDTPL